MTNTDVTHRGFVYRKNTQEVLGRPSIIYLQILPLNDGKCMLMCVDKRNLGQASYCTVVE